MVERSKSSTYIIDKVRGSNLSMGKDIYLSPFSIFMIWKKRTMMLGFNTSHSHWIWKDTSSGEQMPMVAWERIRRFEEDKNVRKLVLWINDTAHGPCFRPCTSRFSRLALTPCIASLELNTTQVRQNIRIREAQRSRYATSPYWKDFYYCMLFENIEKLFVDWQKELHWSNFKII